MTLGEVEDFWYDSLDGLRVHGWTVKPPDFDATRTYPLLLSIHGGPHSQYTFAFNASFQNFAANDYVVVYTNPRGSSGYGTAFGNGIENNYPGKDFDDLMRGVDAVVEQGLRRPSQHVRRRLQRRWHPDRVDGDSDRPVCGGLGTLHDQQLDVVRGDDGRHILVSDVRQVPLGGSERPPPAFPGLFWNGGFGMSHSGKGSSHLTRLRWRPLTGTTLPSA